MHESGGVLLITADHGNSDNMLEPDGSPNTAHSLNPVPVIVTDAGARRCATAACWPTSRRRSCSCSAIEQPAAMTGVSLIKG